MCLNRIPVCAIRDEECCPHTLLEVVEPDGREFQFQLRFFPPPLPDVLNIAALGLAVLFGAAHLNHPSARKGHGTERRPPKRLESMSFCDDSHKQTRVFAGQCAAS